MRRIISIMIFGLAVVFIASCDKNINTAGCIGLGDSTVIKVKYGEKQTLCNNDSTCFSFINLISDSRCPADVQCIWQGTASIELGTCTAKAGSIIQEIDHPVEYVINGQRFTVELTALAPYPNTTQTHDIRDYEATITIQKK